MTDEERTALEATGFHVGTTAEFLGLTDEDRRVIELRRAVVRAVVAGRKRKKLSQAELATRMGTSQPRIAKIEAGGKGFSLDLAFKALFAVGGGLDDLKRSKAGNPKPAGSSTSTRKPGKDVSRALIHAKSHRKGKTKAQT